MTALIRLVLAPDAAQALFCRRLEKKPMSQTAHRPTSIELTETAVRMLKAAALGTTISDNDLRILRSAAGAKDRELPSDELACHIVLREVRARRRAAMTAAKGRLR